MTIKFVEPICPHTQTYQGTFILRSCININTITFTAASCSVKLHILQWTFHGHQQIKHKHLLTQMHLDSSLFIRHATCLLMQHYSSCSFN